MFGGVSSTLYAMFRNAIQLPFKLLGIPISVDRSFLIVLPLFAWLIGSRVPAYLAPSGGLFPYLLGLIAALGLFASVLVHELGHAVTGRLYGAKTKEITLWFFGGVAQFDDMPRQRGAEAVVAIAGPITSVVLAGLFWGLSQIGGFDQATLFVLNYLMVTNVVLAIFNLLPALPMDGGRVLRSLLALKLDYLRATKISVRVSQVSAVLLGLFGLYNRNFFLAAVALFIFNAGRNEARYAVVTRRLEPLKVRDLMHRDVTTVEPEMSLESFARLLHFKRQAAFPVVARDGALLGLVGRQAAEGQPERRRHRQRRQSGRDDFRGRRRTSSPQTHVGRQFRATRRGRRAGSTRRHPQRHRLGATLAKPGATACTGQCLRHELSVMCSLSFYRQPTAKNQKHLPSATVPTEHRPSAILCLCSPPSFFSPS